jgi:cytochrome c oxidase assembly protein subunit 15
MAPSVTFRRLLAGTTALSVPLILVGVYTAIAGFGLTCDARWPLCDGAVFGLFPANWGSFVEWFHRLIAMIFGGTILGTLASARGQSLDRRVLAPVVLATLITPLQIVFGALTVTTYEQVILAAHFSTAVLIFGLLVAATVQVRRMTGTASSITRTAVGSVALLASAIPLTPRFLFVPSAAGHALYYGLALLGLGGLIAAGVTTTGRSRLCATAGGVIVSLGLVLSRITIVSIDQTILVGATVGTTLVGIAAVAVVYGLSDGEVDPGVESGYSGRPN